MRKGKTSLLLTLALLSFISPPPADKVPCEWSGVKKIVAVGDLHGDYENFVKILKKAVLIDENLAWQGGKTHLVQNGDIMDRGPDARKIFDLIMRLEREAEAAGGMVHMLIGNHEELNITGIALDYPGYVTPEQLVSFLPDAYRESLERKRKQDVSPEQFWEDVITKEQKKRNGPVRLKYTEFFNEQYGKWILEHNAVIKINDTVFVHGGISRKYSTWSLEKINNVLRNELTEYRLALKRHISITRNLEFVYAPIGPLWYRDLAEEEEGIFKEEVELILQNLGAGSMVIAHSPRIGSPVISEELMSRFGGRIWIIDTSISDYVPGGIASALVIENGKFSVLAVVEE